MSMSRAHMDALVVMLDGLPVYTSRPRDPTSDDMPYVVLEVSPPRLASQRQTPGRQRGLVDFQSMCVGETPESAVILHDRVTERLAACLPAVPGRRTGLIRQTSEPILSADDPSLPGFERISTVIARWRFASSGP